MSDSDEDVTMLGGPDDGKMWRLPKSRRFLCILDMSSIGPATVRPVADGEILTPEIEYQELEVHHMYVPDVDHPITPYGKAHGYINRVVFWKELNTDALFGDH